MIRSCQILESLVIPFDSSTEVSEFPSPVAASDRRIVQDGARSVDVDEPVGGPVARGFIERGLEVCLGVEWGQ